jgi:hypothetical protein
MEKINGDTNAYWQLATASAAVIAAVLGSALTLYGSFILKRFENRIQKIKESTSQRLKYHLPLLRFTYQLDKRIGHILTELHSDWLDAAHLEKIRKADGFASNPNEKGYFIISSIYMFACFFGWAEAIKQGFVITRPLSEKSKTAKIFSKFKKFAWWLLGVKTKSNVFQFDPEISAVSKLFQHEELFNDYMTSKTLKSPRDACKLHKLIQHSIGELMLQKDGLDNFRLKSFREFFEAYLKDEKFRFWFVLLENLLIDLSRFELGKDIETQVQMKNDIRPLRLLAIRYWCRILMKNMSQELDIETPSCDEVLLGVSSELQNIIKSFKIELVESYSLGIRFKIRESK